jgi:hypothetical protein
VLLAVYELTGERSYATGDSATPFLRAYSTARIVIALAAGALIALKPRLDRAEAMLFGGLMGLALDVEYDYFPAEAFWAAAVLANVSIGLGVAQLIRYALSYLPASVAARRAGSVALAAGALLAIVGFVPVYAFFRTSLGTNANWTTVIAPALERVRWGIFLGACVGIETAAVIAWRHVDGAYRKRLLTVVIGFAPLCLGTGLHSIASVVLGHDVPALADLDVAGTALTAMLLAAGLLSGQLVAVEYYALVALAATVTGIVIAVLAFAAEHFLTPPVERFFDALPALAGFNSAVHETVQVGIAFCVFLTIGRAHEWSTEFVRDLIFAHREEHLAALRTFAEDVGDGSRAEIARRLVEAAVAHAGAIGAALYLRDGGAFRPIASTGVAAVHPIPDGDTRVPALRQPLVPDDGSLTLPMPIGPRLTGFLRCERKRRMTAYAPDEVELLALATRETGIALCVEAPPLPTPGSA